MGCHGEHFVLILPESERAIEDVRGLCIARAATHSWRYSTVDEETFMTELRLLQRQQAMQTRAIRAYVEGRIVGEDSAEAWLYALDPTLQGRLEPKVPRWDT
jgi:hypothetical protein